MFSSSVLTSGDSEFKYPYSVMELLSLWAGHDYFLPKSPFMIILSFHIYEVRL